jgi:hypothetical protein
MDFILCSNSLCTVRIFLKNFVIGNYAGRNLGSGLGTTAFIPYPYNLERKCCRLKCRTEKVENICIIYIQGYYKLGGLIEYPSKFLCAKNCGDKLLDAGVSTALVKMSLKMGQKRKKKNFRNLTSRLFACVLI